jgi:hypothetical protein
MPARYLASLLGCGFTIEQAKLALYNRAPQLTSVEVNEAAELALAWHKDSIVSR